MRLIGRRLQARPKQHGLKHRIEITIRGSMGDTEPQIDSDVSVTDPNYRLWNKGQLIVLVSLTRLEIDTIFVRDKTEKLKSLKTLLIRKNTWIDCMEKALSIIALNASQTNDEQQDDGINRVMNHDIEFIFRSSDMPLPQHNAGHICMILSLKDQYFINIGTTNSIHTRLKSHKSGNGSQYAEPIHLTIYIACTHMWFR